MSKRFAFMSNCDSNKRNLRLDALATTNECKKKTIKIDQHLLFEYTCFCRVSTRQRDNSSASQHMAEKLLATYFFFQNQPIIKNYAKKKKNTNYYHPGVMSMSRTHTNPAICKNTT